MSTPPLPRPPEEASRGEEPERLRAADEGWKMTAEHVGDKCPFGHPWDANEQLATALAEVERLAGERDKAYRATGEYALRATKAEAECERLAGRVAALEAELDHKQRFRTDLADV